MLHSVLERMLRELSFGICIFSRFRNFCNERDYFYTFHEVKVIKLNETIYAFYPPDEWFIENRQIIGESVVYDLENGI